MAETMNATMRERIAMTSTENLRIVMLACANGDVTVHDPAVLSAACFAELAARKQATFGDLDVFGRCA